jgi:predicted nucleotidyltransferase
MIGMNQNTVAITIDIKLARFLCKYPEIRLAILFGSQASGHATNESDIDLAVLADTPLSASSKLHLIEEIGLKFGRPVDIIDMYHVPEPIMGQVFKGKKLIGDTTTYAALLTRHLLNTADFLPLQQRILSERKAAWIN